MARRRVQIRFKLGQYVRFVCARICGAGGRSGGGGAGAQTAQCVGCWSGRKYVAYEIYIG
jgi:hypothetical protein